MSQIVTQMSQIVTQMSQIILLLAAPVFAVLRGCSNSKKSIPFPA